MNLILLVVTKIIPLLRASARFCEALGKVFELINKLLTKQKIGTL